MEIGSIWRHKKTGHVYAVIGFCQLEATNEIGVLYQRPLDRRPWARGKAEFLDGRFEQITPTGPGWQPIETAKEAGLVFAIGWRQKKQCWVACPNTYWESIKQRWIYDGWRTEPVEHLHWMPLPPPPAEGETK